MDVSVLDREYGTYNRQPLSEICLVRVNSDYHHTVSLKFKFPESIKKQMHRVRDGMYRKRYMKHICNLELHLSDPLSRPYLLLKYLKVSLFSPGLILM